MRDALAGRGRVPDGLVRPVPERGGEINERDGQAAASEGREHGTDEGMPRTAGEAHGGKLAAEDRIATQLRARATADAVYADGERKTAYGEGSRGACASLEGGWRSAEPGCGRCEPGAS